MIRTLISLVCIASIFAAAPALAYKRDVPKPPPDAGQEETTPAETPSAGTPQEKPKHAPDAGQAETEQREEEGMGAPPSGRGTVIAGYVMLTVGGLAAIAGSTMIAAMESDTTGIIVSSGGAALSLGGTLMIVLGGPSGYAVGPSVDPKHQTYGLVLAKRF